MFSYNAIALANPIDNEIKALNTQLESFAVLSVVGKINNDQNERTYLRLYQVYAKMSLQCKS